MCSNVKREEQSKNSSCSPTRSTRCHPRWLRQHRPSPPVRRSIRGLQAETSARARPAPSAAAPPVAGTMVKHASGTRAIEGAEGATGDAAGGAASVWGPSAGARLAAAGGRTEPAAAEAGGETWQADPGAGTPEASEGWMGWPASADASDTQGGEPIPHTQPQGGELLRPSPPGAAWAAGGGRSPAPAPGAGSSPPRALSAAGPAIPPAVSEPGPASLRAVSAAPAPGRRNGPDTGRGRAPAGAAGGPPRDRYRRGRVQRRPGRRKSVECVRHPVQHPFPRPPARPPRRYRAAGDRGCGCGAGCGGPALQPGTREEGAAGGGGVQAAAVQVSCGMSMVQRGAGGAQSHPQAVDEGEGVAQNGHGAQNSEQLPVNRRRAGSGEGNGAGGIWSVRGRWCR
eukprot:scaffold16050_cov121-Isochrysis_galbana.AAC.2